MNKEEIEELAFKDRKELANLNELDLLEIIEFLQNDRKQWINQFTQTHNESIDIQKENQELKKQLKECYCNRTDCSGRIKDSKQYDSLVQRVENQQKEFIEYMNKTIEELECDDVDDEEMKGYLIQRIDTFKEILQKYKIIIGDIDENN